MRYDVTGANLGTGEDVRLVIVAPNEENAREQAYSMKIAIASISPEPPPQPPIMSTPPDFRVTHERMPVWLVVAQSIIWGVLFVAISHRCLLPFQTLSTTGPLRSGTDIPPRPDYDAPRVTVPAGTDSPNKGGHSRTVSGFGASDCRCGGQLLRGDGDRRPQEPGVPTGGAAGQALLACSAGV